MECGLIAQDLLNTISHRVLRTIIRHLVSVVKTLTCKVSFSDFYMLKHRSSWSFDSQRNAIRLSNGSTIPPPGISAQFD